MAAVVGTTPKAPVVERDRNGVLRVGQTRIPLATVLVAQELGANPQEISRQFPGLSVEVICRALDYVEQNPDIVNPYMENYRRRVEEVNRLAEAQNPEIKARLLARRNSAK